MSDVHSPEPKAPKVRFKVLCTACGKGEVGWHIIGTDQRTHEARYCGTLLPRGVELLDRRRDDYLAGIVGPVDTDTVWPDPVPFSHFGRLDKTRIGSASPRHVRSGDQVEAPMYPAQPIKEALAACGIRTSFISAIALAPFRTWCDRCGAVQDVDLPEGAIARD
jgi:hypothetical protein